MNQTSPDPAALKDLAGLLRRRLEIIADHAWRDRDPDGQLEALKTVSLEISSAHEGLVGTIHPQLNHFLTQCSYDKALALIEEDQATSET